ncbi:mfs transporter [Lichtheimia corymbifera JMRC:FSU:9682]|uniref:Mfs transporter n=1 Tax=Lichtheimia corymbifera JMRC:FSU:9682 TaxID=1263082 RepID=A0A068RPE3_9FUNG|nr:mfs transporter [Lichtheimia corymbifera JMRC:FSU:9682]
MEPEKKLPAKQLFLVCAVRFAEPVSFSIHVPFIYFMVRDFHLGKDSDIGYYVSLITTAFAISQVISAMPLGMISDRVGRRPMVLCGLAVGIISILFFGLSKTYTWALMTKILSGLLDNNIAIIKSMVSEISAGYSETQRARAFSLLQVVFGLGSIVGAFLGGYLSEPVQKYPSLFNNAGQLTDFLNEYPYFLPCFAAALIDTVCWIAGFLFLEETLIKKEADDNETTRQEQENAPLLDNVDGETYSTFSGQEQQQQEVKPKRPFSDVLTPAVVTICAIYAMTAYQNVFYDELLPTWSATERDTGGLGLNSSEIGTVLSIGGFVTLFVQFFLYHRLTERLGTIRLFRSALFLSIFVYAVQGCVRYLADIPDLHGNSTKTWLFAGLMTEMALKTICQTIAMTGSIILINNAAKRQDSLATINALSQCCSSAMRALGPATCGFIWSTTIAAVWLPFTVRAHLTWIILACIAVTTFLFSVKLKPEYYVSKAR